MIENRIETRIEHKSYILVKEPENGEYHRARMVNYCSLGLCLESDGLFSPDQEINIRIDNSPFTNFNGSGIVDSHHATIIWRRVLGTGFFTYGYGLKISTAADL